MRLGFLEEAANVILIGPNGVGKSTRFRGITGLLQARAGGVALFDRPGRKIPGRCGKAKSLGIRG